MLPLSCSSLYISALRDTTRGLSACVAFRGLSPFSNRVWLCRNLPNEYSNRQRCSPILSSRANELSRAVCCVLRLPRRIASLAPQSISRAMPEHVRKWQAESYKVGSCKRMWKQRFQSRLHEIAHAPSVAMLSIKMGCILCVKAILCP